MDLERQSDIIEQASLEEDEDIGNLFLWIDDKMLRRQRIIRYAATLPVSNIAVHSPGDKWKVLSIASGQYDEVSLYDFIAALCAV